MTLDDVREFFKNSCRFRELTGMSASNFVHWKKLGRVPYDTQKKLEELTGGALKADTPEKVVKIKDNILRYKRMTSYMPGETPYEIVKMSFHPASCCSVHTGTDMECKE